MVFSSDSYQKKPLIQIYQQIIHQPVQQILGQELKIHQIVFHSILESLKIIFEKHLSEVSENSLLHCNNQILSRNHHHGGRNDQLH